jgi:hypothetical protein
MSKVVDHLPNSKPIAESWKIIDIVSITEEDSFIRRNRGIQGWESKNSGEGCREIFRPESAVKKKVGPMRGRCTRPTKVGKHEANLMVKLN